MIYVYKNTKGNYLIW